MASLSTVMATTESLRTQLEGYLKERNITLPDTVLDALVAEGMYTSAAFAGFDAMQLREMFKSHGLKAGSASQLIIAFRDPTQAGAGAGSGAGGAAVAGLVQGGAGGGTGAGGGGAASAGSVLVEDIRRLQLEQQTLQRRQQDAERREQEAERRLQEAERRLQATALALQRRMRTTTSACEVADMIMGDRSLWENADSTTAILEALGTSSTAVATAAAQLAAAHGADGFPVLASWEAMAAKEVIARQRQPVPGAKRRKVAAPRAGTEGIVQLGMGWVIRMVQQHCGSFCWHVHGTSASGLDGKQGPVDYCFMADPQLTAPAQVIFVMELKKCLTGRDLRVAIGQLIDRSALVFSHQPSQRSHLIGIAAGEDGVKVLMIPRLGRGTIKHTGDLKGFRSADGAVFATSEGMRLLLHVLLAAQAAHGFVTLLPPSLGLPGYTFSNLKLADWQSGASELQPEFVATATGRSSHFSSVRSSQVWQAECVGTEQGALLPSQQLVAIKTGAQQHIEQEVMMLNAVAGVQGAIQLLGTGVLHAELGGRAFLVTAPFGRRLVCDDDTEVIMGTMQSVAATLHGMSQLQPALVHRDISIGNIMIVDAAGQGGEEWGRAFVVDFATACPVPAHPVGDNSVLTGTSVFMACSVMAGEPHSLSSDLESLFLVFVYVVSGGHVHWGNEVMSDAAARALKVEALHTKAGFQRYVVPRCKRPDLLSTLQSLHALFYLQEYNKTVDAAAFAKAMSNAE
eukprot:TRINITY_DN8157_c0_g1_i1.p1 TRINITY_DN8157_c0_g1~~TRINITY_DN8157_c0_g1_i1.p1  ORF type:complete len:741 (-),score=196.48 TRINITY_DN8157_c0_g1_i1:256-2478(-)